MSRLLGHAVYLCVRREGGHHNAGELGLVVLAGDPVLDPLLALLHQALALRVPALRRLPAASKGIIEDSFHYVPNTKKLIQ